MLAFVPRTHIAKVKSGTHLYPPWQYEQLSLLVILSVAVHVSFALFKKYVLGLFPGKAYTTDSGLCILRCAHKIFF